MLDLRTPLILLPALLLALTGCSLLPVAANPPRTSHQLRRPGLLRRRRRPTPSPRRHRPRQPNLPPANQVSPNQVPPNPARRR
jgi:hypothetical protein